MAEIEIIIPSYNSHQTISETLESISIQTDMPSFHVTIVNDNGLPYDDIIKKYNFDISEINTGKNVGPGLARQIGIDSTNSKYIMFIDSDDVFYDDKSISSLYKKIERYNMNVVIGNFIYNRDNEVEIKEKDLIWLHGKIYRRSFLEENNVHFNETRYNEDNGFNRFIYLINTRIAYLDQIVYVYKENKNSITRKNDREYKYSGLEWYVYNINWAIDKALQNKVIETRLYGTIINTLFNMYNYYNELPDRFDKNKLIEWSVPIYKKYEKYYQECQRDKKIYEEKVEDIEDFNIFLELIKNIS